MNAMTQCDFCGKAIDPAALTTLSDENGDSQWCQGCENRMQAEVDALTPAELADWLEREGRRETRQAERVAELLRQMPAPTQAKEFCACDGFKHAVEIGAVKEGNHQVLDSKTGKLRHLSYYYIGPKDIRKSVIFQYCPACGKEVQRNHDFLAEAETRGGS